MTPESLISVGRVVKSRGLRGEVVVRSLSDDPERFKTFDEVVVTADDGTSSIYKLESVRTHPRKGGLAEIHLRLEGVDSREASDALRGSLLTVPLEKLELHEDEHFLFDLVGLSVVTDQGEPIGRVADVRPMPAQNIIVIATDDGRETLIPDISEFVDKSKLDDGELIITPIDGLLSD